MTERENGFNGLAADTAPHAVPEGYFQIDAGGDRYFRGVWRKRRGMVRTNLAKFSSTPVAVLSFKADGTDFASGSDYAMMFAAGTHIYGTTTVGEQSF